MPAKLQLSDKQISYSDVKDDESNVLLGLAAWDQRCKFFNHLYRNQAVIRAITAHHLGLNVQLCKVSEPEEWIYGSFNLCIPVSISSWKGKPTKRVIIRFPLSYKVGGRENADQKLRCEAGTYIWLEQHCPSVPIPRLYGFGLSTGQKFIAIEHLPLLLRLAHHLDRRLLNWLKFSVPSRYIRHGEARFDSLGSGYLLIDHIEENDGQMLSCTWNERYQEKGLRKNLFQNLSRILLNIAQVPLPRIGSFTVDNNGFLILANKPLSLIIHQLENEQIPVDIPRHLIYTSVDSYMIDTLNCLHDGRLRHQPNGVSDTGDYVYQMSTLAAMKATSSLFLRRDLRHGPFILSLTDLHQSNIFVDDDWNITCLIDLEWAFSCPVEMIHPSRWLANQAIDEMDEKIYDPVRREFLDVLEETEQELSIQFRDRISVIMKQAWEMGTFWYTLALRSPMGLVRVFYDHIQPILANGHEENDNFYTIMMEYWTIETIPFINKKLADKEDYDEQLRQAFEDKVGTPR